MEFGERRGHRINTTSLTSPYSFTNFSYPGSLVWDVRRINTCLLFSLPTYKRRIMLAVHAVKIGTVWVCLGSWRFWFVVCELACVTPWVHPALLN